MQEADKGASVAYSEIPDEYLGAVLGDLSGRRGKILGMDVAGRLQVVKALVPAAQVRLARLLAVLERDGAFSHQEVEFVRKDGSRLTVSVSVTPVRDERAWSRKLFSGPSLQVLP